MHSNKRPDVIAHRGASGHAPENTLAAFGKAMDMGADWAELDVQLTLDEQVVVIHDPTLERTTSFAGNVCDYTLTELQQADAGSWFSPEFRSERVPALDQVLDLVRGRMRLNIEIKNRDEYSTVVDNVLHILKKNLFHDVFISSFSRDIIELVKDIDASIKTGYLFDRKLLKNVFAGNWDYLCPGYSLVNEEFMKKTRGAGKKIFAWTVNSPLEMQKMIGLGVDGIITNYPGELIKLL